MPFHTNMHTKAQRLCCFHIIHQILAEIPTFVAQNSQNISSFLLSYIINDFTYCTSRTSQYSQCLSQKYWGILKIQYWTTASQRLNYSKSVIGLPQTSKWATANQQVGYCKPASGLLQTTKWTTSNQQVGYCKPASRLVQTRNWTTANQQADYFKPASGLLQTSKWATANQQVDYCQ